MVTMETEVLEEGEEEGSGGQEHLLQLPLQHCLVVLVLLVAPKNLRLWGSPKTQSYTHSTHSHTRQDRKNEVIESERKKKEGEKRLNPVKSKSK